MCILVCDLWNISKNIVEWFIFLDLFDQHDERDDDAEGESVEEHKSVIMHLLSQVRLGMDLTKVTVQLSEYITFTVNKFNPYIKIMKIPNGSFFIKNNCFCYEVLNLFTLKERIQTIFLFLL